MPKESCYKGAWIRLYRGRIRNEKFFYFVDTEGKDYDTVSRLKGDFDDVCMLLMDSANETPGWAYAGGMPLGDRHCARQLHYPVSYWVIVKDNLVKAGLLNIDEHGAWGVGAENWDFHQGAPIHKRRYDNKYHKDKGDEAEMNDVPLPPQKNAGK